MVANGSFSVTASNKVGRRRKNPAIKKEEIAKPLKNKKQHAMKALISRKRDVHEEHSDSDWTDGTLEGKFSLVSIDEESEVFEIDNVGARSATASNFDDEISASTASNFEDEISASTAFGEKISTDFDNKPSLALSDETSRTSVDEISLASFFDSLDDFGNGEIFSKSSNCGRGFTSILIFDRFLFLIDDPISISESEDEGEIDLILSLRRKILSIEPSDCPESEILEIECFRARARRRKD